MSTTREKVLCSLIQRQGRSVSGEELARLTGVSRAAVWKAIDALRLEGHEIEAATKRGYRLSEHSDVLCRETVLPHLTSKAELLFPKEVGSTNTLLRELANGGAPHGTLILAAQQNSGRGRRGRSFLSPVGGIYLSVLLRPRMRAEQGVRLTIAACVGVCRALEATCQRKGGIKWVNDIFLAGKKVCGILTEASTSVESGLLEYAVVGVGLNYLWPKGGFPPELADIAGSVYGPGERPAATRGRMAAALIDALMDVLERPEDADIMDEYRARSMVRGKRVLVLHAGGERPALAEDILSDGSLRVRYAGGAVEDLCSGEVSILPDMQHLHSTQ